MNILKLEPPTISTLTVLLLAIIFSSFTLWLAQSWIKYPLFFYEIFVIVVIYLLLRNGDDGNDKYYYYVKYVNAITENVSATLRSKKIFLRSILDILLIIFSSILILLNGFFIQRQEGGGLLFQLVLAFLCTSFLSGYALLNIFKISKYFSKLEILPLSFLLSFIFSGSSALFLLPIEEHSRCIILPILYTFIGIISVALRVKGNENKETRENLKYHHSLSRNIDILAIIASLLFYILFFYAVYPSFALVAGTDISRHYNYSVVLSRTPELYTQSSYILFHAFNVSLYNLSGLSQPITSFQSILAILNIFLPLLIYTFAKRFLGDFDRRIPSLSTLFYSILSNLSFIYVTQLKLMNIESSSVTQMLGINAAEKSFNSTINFLQPFAWFVPLSVSFMLFIVAFILLRVHNIPKSKFVPIFSVLILAMYLTHVTEAVIFTVFIVIYSLISKSNSVRLDDVLISSFIGFVAAAAFLGYQSFFWTSELSRANIDYKVILAVIIPILLVSISMFWRSKVLHRIEFTSKFKVSARFSALIPMLLIALYVFGFFAWFFADDFRTSSIYDIGAVPWFIYPLMLGIVGLLALLSIRYLEYSSSLSIILASILIMFLLGRIVSFLNFNLNYVAAGYWEKRFLIYLFLFVSVLAPIPLIKFRDQVTEIGNLKKIKGQKKRQIYKITLLSSIICIVVFSGFSSLVLQSEYWHISANASKISGKELQAITYMKNMLQSDKYAFVVSPSEYSRNVLTLAAPPYQLSLPEIIVSSKHPELPLLGLAAHNLGHAYIYMHSRDFKIINEQERGWFTDHLISMLPVAFSNGEVTIYNATHVMFPLSNSDTKMIIPSDPFQASENSIAYAYDVISQSDKNYTVTYDEDPNALKAKTVVLSFDPKAFPRFFEKFSGTNNNNSNWNIISGNWNYLSNGLHGGGLKNKTGNVILSPISSKNLITSTSFRVNNVNPKNASYVSIVYSWVDTKNYKFAGIMIYNKAIYVNFATVVDGMSLFDPAWPGIKTSLKWKSGDLFNLTFQDNSNDSNGIEQLTLNGTQYSHAGRLKSSSNTSSNSFHQNIGAPGYIGLSYGRVNDVAFDHFRSQRIIEGTNNTTADFGKQELSNYISYIKSGGHIVVLNTNGYGSIANFLFNPSNYHEINTNITRYDMRVSDNSSGSNYHQYSNENRLLKTSNSKQILNQLSPFNPYPKGKSSFFATELKVGLGRITYINIYPLISPFSNDKISGKETYQILGMLSTLIDSGSLNSQPKNFRSLPASFESLTEKHGRVFVYSSSLLFPRNSIDRIKITTFDHKEYSLGNIAHLKINGYNYATMQGTSDTNVTLSNGKGLYAYLNLNSPNSRVKVSFANSSGHLPTILGQSNAKTFQVNNISSISIINRSPLEVYARQPQINFDNSNVIFKNLRYSQSNILGDTRVTGKIYLSVFMSDTSTFVDHIDLHGSIQSLSSMPAFNEIKYLVPSISIEKLYSIPSFARTLSLIPILVAGFFIVYVRPKN